MEGSSEKIDRKLRRSWLKLVNNQIPERQYRDRVLYLKLEQSKSDDALSDGIIPGELGTMQGAITRAEHDIQQRIYAARDIRKEISHLEKEVRAEQEMGIVWTPLQKATSKNSEDAVEQEILPRMSAAERLWTLRNKYDKKGGS